MNATSAPDELAPEIRNLTSQVLELRLIHEAELRDTSDEYRAYDDYTG
ncbi:MULTISPECIES: hypothetical protein [Streptomyces]|nr:MULTISPECIES: hypothetical protein [Streptomyces]MYS66507.1 hypothetical protein [Streptomyces sp. SID5473]